jgi:hypothetical protein
MEGRKEMPPNFWSLSVPKQDPDCDDYNDKIYSDAVGYGNATALVNDPKIIPQDLFSGEFLYSSPKKYRDCVTVGSGQNCA